MGKLVLTGRLTDVMKAAARPVELPVYRGNVVPGSVQLRLPADGAVHYSYYARRKARSASAPTNTGVGWRNTHREDAHDLDADQVVRRALGGTRFSRAARK